MSKNRGLTLFCKLLLYIDSDKKVICKEVENRIRDGTLTI